MIVHKVILADLVSYKMPKPEAQVRLRELDELTRTYGGLTVVESLQRRAEPDHRTFIGKGKVEELVKVAPKLGATLLVVNEILKPQQIYNLEEAFRGVKVQVWDRIDLILHIFDRHATSAEAKLQIELARLRHMGPRIYNLGSQLGRQRGGTGTRGGSGEGNTEAMKRHMKEQERRILQKLQTYEHLRAEQRKNRRRNDLQTVALVGYTNAGKTSLLNALTNRKELAENKLFATLDTRVGELYLKSQERSVLLSDTIGFIRDLPPQLIEAFRSTLSEAVHADLLLHVIDAADPEREKKIEVVREVLDQLGVLEHAQLRVFNKADLLTLEQKEAFTHEILVSAVTGTGIERLDGAIGDALSPTRTGEVRQDWSKIEA